MLPSLALDSSSAALAVIDPYILAFSAITVIATIWMGFWAARKSKTASDFFVAGRTVSVGWNASAISGEYLSAASFMGVAGMVMSSGYDALWYPVCYACGYLFLLLFIAGPLRRFGAYTIPDFAEGRYDSPVFRKIAVVFVLFIGFFYTMPQMKGAGTTLAYIFPGLPYWVGVALVGAVITLNVALGGMKGITLVQAFQYWLKMFAIAVPIFVLMAVYGHYGRQLGANGANLNAAQFPRLILVSVYEASGVPEPTWLEEARARADAIKRGVEQIASRVAGIRTIEGSGAIKMSLRDTFINLAESRRDVFLVESSLTNIWLMREVSFSYGTNVGDYSAALERALKTNGVGLIASSGVLLAVPFQRHLELDAIQKEFGLEALTRQPPSSSEVLTRSPLPEKAPADSTWLSPFGPLTTKAAKATAAAMDKAPAATIPLRAGLAPEQRLSVHLDAPTPTRALAVYGELIGRQLAPRTNSLTERVDDLLGGALTRLKLVSPTPAPDNGVRLHNDGPFTVAEVKSTIEGNLRTNGLALVATGDKMFTVAAIASSPGTAWLADYEKPLALLYTYSLIIALVCGTAGLPHILVRFYTNPDGVAAKRTTMWVMILIGIFYVFPPVFGVIGRNLMPELYSGVGAKGTDKIVLELPRILNEKYGVLGSVLSGITCAGAFAAFMSTFSGLLVSMTGALAHDVYGRMLKPKSTPDQRMRMFKVSTVICGGVAVLLGMQVEALQINFMVGQAFAIAAASYFPLLFMSVWWRGMTMKGAAIGMLTGGICALAAVTLTNFSDLKWVNLDGFWAVNPLLRILCEQPAIWTVPLAIGLMIVVSKLTRNEAPSDVRMKMLVLHAPEKLGLKQEYIQEHQSGH